MNKTIEAFNENRLLGGESETLEQYRAVSNAIKEMEHELFRDEQGLRQSGMFTDAGVEERMVVKRQQMLNLLGAYEDDIVKPRQKSVEAKAETVTQRVPFTEDEKTRAINRYNAGKQFRDDLIIRAIGGDKKLASILVSAEDYEVDMAPSTREELVKKATIASGEELRAVQTEIEAGHYIARRIDDMKQKLENGT